MSTKKYPAKKTVRERILIALLKAHRELATPLRTPRVSRYDWPIMRDLVREGLLELVPTRVKSPLFYRFTADGLVAAQEAENRPELDTAEARDRYDKGESVRQIAGDTYAYSSVHDLLADAGVRFRDRGGVRVRNA
jgi:hypothetical protein